MNNLSLNDLTNRLRPWTMWILGAMAFFIEYIIRVGPGSMIPSLMQTFNASSLDISAFSAYFLYAYVAMQIPVGLLVDRFGARKCLSLSTLLCSFSTLLFSSTTNLYIADGARLLLGLGAAFALVGTLKLALVWFKPQFFSILVGITQSLGMIGGAAGVCIMGRLAELHDWQICFQLFGITLGIIALLIAILVRNHPPKCPSTSLKNNDSFTSNKPLCPTPKFREAITIVLQSRQTWLVALYAGLLYMPTAVFGELWGGFYLITTQNLSTTLANDGVSTIFVGWAIGAPVCGILANRFGRKPIMIFSAVLSLIFISCILYVPPIPVPLLYTLLFFFGIGNSGMVSAYTTIAELNPKAVGGVALGFGNGMSVIVGAFCQQLVGAMIDWLHSDSNNLEYASLELKMAMSIVTIGVVLAFVISLFTKETLQHV